MPKLFDARGGYRKLDAFTFASIIQLETLRFCQRFLTLQNDPKGRQFDQMTQAARSGRANLMEGSERAGTSKTDEIRLTDVARASLAELMGDYEIWLMSHGMPPWKADSPEAKAVAGWQLEPRGEWADTLHDSCAYVMAQQKRFARWTDGESVPAANALLILCKRTIAMLGGVMSTQAATYVAGGKDLRQRMLAVRRETRDSAPACPLCGKPMRRQLAHRGPDAGKEFWSCTDYPHCRGSRSI